MWKFLVICCGILIASCNGFLSFAFNEAMKNYLYQINVDQPDVYDLHGQYGYSNVFNGKIVIRKTLELTSKFSAGRV